MSHYIKWDILVILYCLSGLKRLITYRVKEVKIVCNHGILKCERPLGNPLLQLLSTENSNLETVCGLSTHLLTAVWYLTVSWGITRAGVTCSLSGPTRYFLNENLYFIKKLRGFICTLKFEKHWSRNFILQITDRKCPCVAKFQRIQFKFNAAPLRRKKGENWFFLWPCQLG